MLLQGAGYRRTKLSKKISESNLGPERSGLTEEKDPEAIRKKVWLERKAERPKQQAEREIIEITGPDQKAKREERIEQRDFISL